MKKEVRDDLRAAVLKNERIVVFLHSTGERIKGIADHSSDPERVKINTDEGSVWITISDVKSVSRVIRLRVEGTTWE